MTKNKYSGLAGICAIHDVTYKDLGEILGIQKESVVNYMYGDNHPLKRRTLKLAQFNKICEVLNLNDFEIKILLEDYKNEKNF